MWPPVHRSVRYSPRRDTKTFLIRLAAVAVALILVSLVTITAVNYSRDCSEPGPAAGSWTKWGGVAPQKEHKLTALGACR